MHSRLSITDITKKALMLLLFVAFSNKIYAQKCETNNDPFSGEQILSFDYERKTVYFEFKNDTILFEIVFNYLGERNYEFKEGTKILMKLEDGTKMELSTARVSLPRIEQVTSSNGFYPGFGGGMMMSSSSNYTAYSFAFTLTKTDLNKLAASQIEVIRIPDTTEGTYADLEAKSRTKKKVKAVNKGAICLKEHIDNKA
ncbi:hypothetical protein ACFSKN_03545 [Mariniflexile gromovii]|uniref:GLPGLI family protein n=1 Tax=Mariniflexile gromovii TaxID=362523 RepID=A0ABS4BSS6_9FLAO|nr:hypothetical protein [Mariniflexile gromovii]MBP0903638.1 hypothetical protein [Mariniflexile gromovii]